MPQVSGTQGATEGELKYQGAPSAISGEDTRQIMAAGGPVLSEAEFCNGHAAVFRTLRRLPRRAAQRCNGQGADAGHYDGEGHGIPESADYLRLTGRYAELGYVGRSDRSKIDIMARFLQQEPPAPPEFGMPEMQASWKLMVAPEDRPTEPQHDRNIDNFFSVTLRDAGRLRLSTVTPRKSSASCRPVTPCTFRAVRVGSLRVHDRP